MDKISQDALAARKLGLTYGQYMLRKPPVIVAKPKKSITGNKVPVMARCIETGEEKYYKSTKETVKDGFAQSAVCNCLSGRFKSSHGWTFRRATEEEIYKYDTD